MALMDMNDPGADQETQDTAQPSLPAGGAPAGGGLGSILGRALAVGLAGFAPPSSGLQPLMMKQVMDQQNQEQRLALMAGIGKAMGVVNQHVTNGDLDKANEAYRALLQIPGAAGMPQVWAMGKDIQDRAYTLQQRRGLAAILGQPRTQQVTIPGTGTPGTPDQPLGTASMVPGKEEAPPETPGEPPVQQQPTSQGAQYDLTKKGTLATPDQTVNVDMRDKIVNDLVASGQMSPKDAREFMFPAPQIIDGPLGSKWAYDHRSDTMKVLTPGTLDLSPGKTVSLADFGNIGPDGKPKVTQIAAGGAKPVTYADLDVKDRALLPAIGSSRKEWDALATSTDPADEQRRSDLSAKLDLSRAIRDADPLLTQAAVSVGVNPQVLAINGLAAMPAQQVKDIHGALQDFEVQKQANALRTSEGLKMQQPVLVAMPQLGNKMLVTKDGKFNMIEPSAFGTGADFTRGYDPNKFAMIDAKEKDQLELLNATTPIIGGIKKLLPDIYKFGKDHPGATIGQFVEFYAKSHTGASPELAALGSLNVGLAAEITRATTGGTRPAVQVFNKVTDVDTPSWKDSIDTAVRKVDTAEQTIDVRRRSLTHMPVGEIDPTRPIPGFTGAPMQKNPLGFNVPTR